MPMRAVWVIVGVHVIRNRVLSRRYLRYARVAVEAEVLLDTEMSQRLCGLCRIRFVNVKG